MTIRLRTGVEFRISTPKQEIALIEGISALIHKQFRGREIHHGQDTAATRQTLRHALHEGKDLRAGQKKSPRSAVSIYHGFQMSDQRGCILDLVNDEGEATLLKKTGRILLCLCRSSRKIQRKVPSIRKYMPNEGRLSHVPPTCDHHRRKLRKE